MYSCNALSWQLSFYSYSLSTKLKLGHRRLCFIFDNQTFFKIERTEAQKG